MLQHLSPRESEVVRLVALGMANKEIAAELGMSSNTVKGHVESIMKKLQAKNRAAAAAVWLRAASAEEGPNGPRRK